MKWPSWFDENKRFCPSKAAVIWLKRATGIGYREFPPLVGSEVDPEAGDKMLLRSRQMVSTVEHLERELRRIGVRSSS